MKIDSNKTKVVVVPSPTVSSVFILASLASSNIVFIIGLSRIDETTGIKIKPNFIVCMDKVSESSIKAAQQFNIPIYLIKRQYYSELPYIESNNNHLTETQSIEETESLKR